MSVCEAKKFYAPGEDPEVLHIIIQKFPTLTNDIFKA